MIGRPDLRSAAAALLLATSLSTACVSEQPKPTVESPRHLVVITIDTLRADRVGAYGYGKARTPHIDAIAGRGSRFDSAYATAPITLPSHASLMTGRYPPGHGARHNGQTMDASAPTLAEALKGAGFATGGFVAAFPLDRRFGINKGFDTFGDQIPRGLGGTVVNERPGREVVSEALAWLEAHRSQRVFLWVHLFEPHAPYGDPRTGRSIADRYDDEVAEADAQVGRLLQGLGAAAARSVIVVASDHGEAFGEHGEITHSLFVYDTTLRVPLVIAGPGIAKRTISAPVSLVDVAPTVLKLLDVDSIDADGIDLGTALSGGNGGALTTTTRPLYAESWAPLLDFGWSPLRAIRLGDVKFIDAPRPELFNIAQDPDETQDIARDNGPRVAELREVAQRYAGPLPGGMTQSRDVQSRLQSLGYVGGGTRDPTDRPDPKDRRQLAAAVARVASGELDGAALEEALRGIVKQDPQNPQANLRLGYVLSASNRCAEAMPHYTRAIAAQLPSVDAHLGLAQCQLMARRLADAVKTLTEAERLEPGNPVVAANLGIVLSDAGRHADAIAALQRALKLDPGFHEARFNLSRVFARAGRREEAAREAQTLLDQLPATAPQRAEVQRLLNAVK
jgi:choline-sulfatase